MHDGCHFPGACGARAGGYGGSTRSRWTCVV